MLMSFPDQSHINRVRDALWQRPDGASVMVGSGFSRNAVPVRPNVGTLPTWDQVTNRLHEELYPQEKSSIYRDALRTAQEYEAAFGRTKLHEALRKLVPHEGYNPSPAHQRLLNLPWADIYTTNWDDLLERARSDITEWDYSVVTSMDQIPMEPRPRIVKLHGSLPGQFPLIVTDEDYRTYPTKFAPFVNTVQQAMMETVFFLIGFSGEDPNFLNWSGWVRDNLGASAPKIYLAGHLQLSQHRRRMLEERNVVPIDLAQHPQSSMWREQNLHHQYATEWLLHTLENGEPYDVTDWPSLPSKQPIEIPEVLQPVDTVSSVLPRAEPTTPEPEGQASNEEVREITEIWRHNRLMYPGWLTVPSSNRREMEWKTNEWGHKILLSFPNLTTTERLYALRELVWREEVLLVPMYPNFESAIEETLNAIDCHDHILDGVHSPNEDWPTVREGWRYCAAALLTAARFRLDRDSFEKWIKALTAFQTEDTEILHRIHHEKCLWANYDLDFNSLNDLLADWQTENCDPAWMMRKSAVLWEAGHDNEAEDVLQRAIVAVRAIPRDERSIAGPSREAWATLVALGWDNHQMLVKRLRELAPFRCDVFGERLSVLDAMGENGAEDEPPVFDVNRRRGTGLRFSNYDPQAAAYRAIRLSEVAGIPPFATALATNLRLRTNVWADVLKKAAEEMAHEHLEFAVRLVLRSSSGHNDKTLGRVLSRTSLATLPTKGAESLAEACLRVINTSLQNPVTAEHQPRTEPAIEVLSRLAIRVGPDLSETILDKALECCRDPRLMRGTSATVTRHLLERSWEALPDKNRHRRALDLMNAPVAGLDSEPPLMEFAWADPVELFANDSTVLRRTSDNEHLWKSAVDLVVRGLNGNAAVRHRTSIRMIPLVHSGLLTDDESQEIAHALWTETTLQNGLPANLAMFDWAFLTFPETELGLTQKRFIAKWLTGEYKTGWQHKTSIEIFGNSTNGLNHDPHDVDSRLWQVGEAMMSLRSRGRRLKLSDTEKTNLQELVEIWAEATMPEFAALDHPLLPHVGYAHKERIRAVTQVFPAITGEIGLSKEVGEKLFAKLQTLNENQIPALALATSVVKASPKRLADVATALRVGMTSNKRDLAADAVEGVRLWIEATLDAESGTPHPPEDLVREIGIAIASRRSPVMPGALATARWIFANGDQIHKKAIRHLAQDGLSYLAEELRYDREHDTPDDVPLQRLFCAQLAAAMAKDELHQRPAVLRWLEIAKEDPLPEVRNAVALDQEVEDDDNRITAPEEIDSEITP